MIRNRPDPKGFPSGSGLRATRLFRGRATDPWEVHLLDGSNTAVTIPAGAWHAGLVVGEEGCVFMAETYVGHLNGAYTAALEPKHWPDEMKCLPT